MLTIRANDHNSQVRASACFFVLARRWQTQRGECVHAEQDLVTILFLKPNIGVQSGTSEI